MAPPARSDSTPRLSLSPGDAILHPVALAAVAGLVVNDQVAKAAWPGVVTGKVSDVAGMVFFPVFLQALWEVGQSLTGRWREPSRRVLVACVAATGLAFAATQLWTPAAWVWTHGLGLLQWPFLGFPAGGPVPVRHVMDVTDLLALPALGVAWLIAHRRVTPIEARA